MIPILFTAQCILRPLTAHDRDGLIDLKTDPAVRQFLGGPQKEMVAKASAEALIFGNTLSLAWAVRLREQKEAGCIGLVTVAPHHNESDRELSYQFLPAYWGLGFAFECTQAVLRHAFDILGLPRLVSETQAANRASRSLLERLGMREAGTVERFGEPQIIYDIVNPLTPIISASAPAG
ncbi:GNAT family N-acetyltransferase [Rhizobium sp. FY34]|uniref:GNAT family N-acetyltransferase n=1 Tax=Rhizobium sp. FY34 TaxID=2562309 RepID=UPI0010C0A676|nr:GNAT family N-acetyltransferase [Rhizobium sp. FY34]